MYIIKTFVLRRGHSSGSCTCSGILSGGMDSTILVSYMPVGTKAYTARCIGENAIDETEQAKRYCNICNLDHVIVDVD